MIKMEIDYIQMGMRIRTLRKSQGMSQEWLAELANYSPPYISHVERGVKKPSLSALIRIASALKVTVDYLLSGVQPADQGAYLPDVQALLNDCSLVERRIVLEVAVATKGALRGSGWAK